MQYEIITPPARVQSIRGILKALNLDFTITLTPAHARFDITITGGELAKMKKKIPEIRIAT